MTAATLDGYRPPRRATLKSLYAVDRFIRDHGYAPTVREIADDLGVAGSTALRHLRILRDHGYIDFHDGEARTIRILDGACRCGGAK